MRVLPLPIAVSADDALGASTASLFSRLRNWQGAGLVGVPEDSSLVPPALWRRRLGIIGITTDGRHVRVKRKRAKNTIVGLGQQRRCTHLFAAPEWSAIQMEMIVMRLVVVWAQDYVKIATSTVMRCP